MFVDCQMRKLFVSHSQPLLSALLCFLIYQAYSNTFYSPPALDDFHSFIDEPLVKIDNWSLADLLLLADTKFSWKRWMPMITFSWDIWLGKGEFFFLHLTNLIIHLSCFLSVFFLIKSISESLQYSNKPQIHQPLPIDVAIWTAAIWALNPIQTNAVTYLVQRMTSLMALFYVLSIAFYIKGRISFNRSSRLDISSVTCFVLSSCAAMLAFISKENSFMIPFMTLITEIWFFGSRFLKPVVRFFHKHWLLAIIILLLLCIFGVRTTLDMLNGYSGRHFTFEQRLLTQARIVVWYMSVIMWPHPGRLSLEHHVELSTSLLTPPTTLLSILAIGFLCWWAVSKRKRFPVATYGIIWFFLNLILESSIVPLELLFEHRMYLPSIGMILSVVLLTHHTFSLKFQTVSSKDFRTVAWCFAAVACSLLTLGTFERNQTWHDVVSLNADDVAKNPKSPRAHANLAVALARVGSYREAIGEAKITIELGQENYEEYGVAANTLITSYSALKEYENGIKEGEKLLNEWPRYADAYALPMLCLALARCYIETGNLEKALQLTQSGLEYNERVSLKVPNFEIACERVLHLVLAKISQNDMSSPLVSDLATGDITPKYWIATMVLKLGNRSLARALLAGSLKENPEDDASRLLLEALVKEDEKNVLQSRRWSFTEKYVRRPFSRFDAYMAAAYLVREHKFLSPFMSVGEAFLDTALKLKPEEPDAHLLKGWYHYERNEAAEAVEAAQHALALDPEYAKAWIGLGFFLAKANRPQEAVVALKKTLELYPGYPQRLAILDVIASLQGAPRT